MTLTNNLHLKLKTHCENKLDLYKKMLNEFDRKSQSKHVSFDGSINLNNNNSTLINTTSSTSQQYTHHRSQNIHKKKTYRTDTYTKPSDTNR